MKKSNLHDAEEEEKIEFKKIPTSWGRSSELKSFQQIFSIKSIV
jgi:hypothetical protein